MQSLLQTARRVLLLKGEPMKIDWEYFERQAAEGVIKVLRVFSIPIMIPFLVIQKACEAFEKWLSKGERPSGDDHHCCNH